MVTETKEPWEMTREEYNTFIDTPQGKAEWDKLRAWNNEQSKLGRTDKIGQKAVYVYREEVVIPQALSEGKPVPPEVLKDYPELKPVAPEVTAPEPTFKMGDKVIYKGEEWEVGFVNQLKLNLHILLYKFTLT